MVTIKSLSSGGLITNYYCSSQCRHCLYACGPKWDKEYITPETAAENFRKLRELGCYSVHIGGGEPMLDTGGLAAVLDTARVAGMGVEYVETNSSWFTDLGQAEDVLKRLKSHGLQTLLISISPFHNEYIPFKKVKGVIAACQATGIGVFPWIRDFYEEIDNLGDEKKHSMEEFIKAYGESYFADIPNRYWITMRGRALRTYRHLMPEQRVEAVLEQNSSGCGELGDTGHFHIDLFGGYIPGLCSGFSIKREDLGTALPADTYPLMTMLYDQGIGALYRYAADECGFVPKPGYVSKCHLCQDIRKHLVVTTGKGGEELGPEQYYIQLSREGETAV